MRVTGFLVNQQAPHRQLQQERFERIRIAVLAEKATEVGLQALPALLQFVRAFGAGEGLQGGRAQGALQLAPVMLLLL